MLFCRNLRYGIRTFRKAPGFAFVAVLAVAFGIGVNFRHLHAFSTGWRCGPLAGEEPERSGDGLSDDSRSQEAGDTHGFPGLISLILNTRLIRDQNHVLPPGWRLIALAQVTLGGS